MFRSIRGLLTAWYTAILAATMLVLSVGAWVGLRTSIQDTVDGELRARLRGLNEFLENQAKHPDGESLADELYEQAGINPAGAPLRIADHTGHWLYAARSTRGWGRFDPTPGVRTITVSGETWRVLTAKALPGTVQLGAPLGAFNRVLQDFAWTAILASPLLLLLAGFGGYWLSGRALAPVEAITRTAHEIGANDLSRRLPVRGAHDELDRLSETLNGMFGRLESSFRRITQFTADASHELRTPVAVIRTTAELARSAPRSAAEYEEALDSILAESERTSSLIDDLLLLARADAPGTGMEFEPLNLAEELRDVCAEARVLAIARGLNLSLGPTPTVEIQADREALHRLLLALLDNAVKYTPAGGEVQVALDSSANEARISISDTGIGIPASDLPRIFERFYRASQDRRREDRRREDRRRDGGSSGAGLGLSIAQWIAERHGGRITAESRPGQGTTFLVSLPLLSGEVQNSRAY